MRRLAFIASAVIAAAMGGALAQHARRHRLVIVHPSDPISEMSDAGANPSFPVFFKELRRLGYVEGENLIVERYSGEGRIERDAELARKAVGTNPDVIFAFSTRILLALQEVTATVPIVGIGGDPVAQGLVPNLARPGGQYHRRQRRRGARTLRQAPRNSPRGCPSVIASGAPPSSRGVGGHRASPLH